MVELGAGLLADDDSSKDQCSNLVRAQAQYSTKDQTLRVPMAQADQPQPLSPMAIAVSAGQPKSAHSSPNN